MSKILSNNLKKLSRAQAKQIAGGLQKCLDAPIGGHPYCPPGSECINGICRKPLL